MNWILIPARKGSKCVPGKNTRMLAGRPLVTHVIGAAEKAFGAESIVVSTDDPAIARLLPARARLFERPESLAGDATTLDEVAVEVARQLVAQGASLTDVLLTVQPTSPFISAESLQRAADKLDTGAGAVLSVVDDRHLRWTIDERGAATALFAERVNRQWLPPVYAETGGVIGAHLGDIIDAGTRIVGPVELLVLDDVEGLDIDTFADWAVAEFFANRRSIVIRADGARSLGMGHVYRALALEHALAAHDLVIVTRADGEHALGADFLAGSSTRVWTISDEQEFFDLLEAKSPDIAILDVLDTQVDYVERVKSSAGWVTCIEDLGPGSHVADLVINDLYTDLYPCDNHWYGVQYALLGPQFEAAGPTEPAEEVKRVLVTFGGSDPQNLTRKALAALGMCEFAGEVECVLGPGYAHEPFELAEFGLAGEVRRSATNLADIMHASDVALTSAGRTVTELMTQGIPTIAMCQNERELMHTHASGPFGVVNLGLGEHVTVEGLASHLGILLSDAGLRRSMHDRMLKAVNGRSNQAIAQMILNAATTREGVDA